MTTEEKALKLAQEFGATKANKEQSIYRACIRMAEEQRAIDSEKDWQWMVDWVFENAPHEVFDELMSSREDYIKAMKDEK